MQKSVVIIGAGVTGMTLARRLKSAGHAVTLLDKGRGIGGRLASRDVESLTLNHGATRFKLRKDHTPTELADWLRTGLVAQGGDGWLNLIDGGRAFANALSADLNVRTSMTVTTLKRQDNAWHLSAKDSDDVRHRMGPFDQLVLTVPAPQAMALLKPLNLLPDALFERAVYQPQWTLLAAFNTPVALSGLMNGAFQTIDIVENRALVAQASAAWTAENLGLEKPDAAEKMLQALCELCPELPATRYLRGHRWLYCHAISGPREPAFTLSEFGLGLAGDWFDPTGDPAHGIATALRSAEALLERISQ